MSTATNYQEILGFFTYNPETGEIFSKHGRKVGTPDFEGYIRVSFFVSRKSKRFRAHRLAWLAMTGEWPSADIDHINGVRHDNRWANLRLVDRATNNENQRRATRQNKTSGLLGVSYSAPHKKWVAQIQVKGRNRNLGRFASADEAHAAYLDAKRSLHSGCTI